MKSARFCRCLLSRETFRVRDPISFEATGLAAVCLLVNVTVVL